MESSLDTTNLLLGIMAAVSVLQVLFMVGAGIVAWRAYKALVDLATDVGTRHVAPTLTRVNGMLDDVSHLTSTVKGEAERVDYAINRTIGRVDDTARRMRSNVVVKTSRVVGFVRGVRAAIESLLEDNGRVSRPGAGT
jgi:hypothetical protein